MQSTARLWFGPDPDLLKPSGRPYGPPQHGFYWKTWHILFSILSSGHTESFGCRFPAIQGQDYRCSFHAYLADSFLLFSICCLTSFPLLHVSNQQLTHGGFLPVRGSEHGISCRRSVPHRWLHPCCLLLQAGHLCQSNPNVITIPLAALHIHWFAEVFCITLSSRSIITMH